MPERYRTGSPCLGPRGLVSIFSHARRQGNDETAYVAASHLRQLFGHRFEVPVWLEDDAWPDHAEGKLGKRCQVVRKEDLKDNLRGIVG